MRLLVIVAVGALALCADAQEAAVRAQIVQAEADARARPNDTRVVGALAMTLHAYQHYEEAARVYSRAHQLSPQSFDWLYLLGAVEMERGNFTAAAEALESALQIRPGDLAAQLRLAQSLAGIPDFDRAARAYRHILEQHGDCARAWYGLGQLQAAQGDHTAAAGSYRKAIDLFPAYGAAEFALAGELRRLGSQVAAQQLEADYARASTREPPLDDPLFRRIRGLNQSAQAHLVRGAELDKAGKLQEAIQEHEAALEIDPDNVQAHVNLISLYARSGDNANAKRHFEAAVRLSPGRSDAWYGYGVLLLRQKNYGEAETAFRRALESNPDEAEAHQHLGAIYELQGQLDRAAGEYRLAIASKPDYPLSRFRLGRILANQEKYDEAIQQLRRALQPESDQTPTYQYALAATYARAGDREHALEFFRAAHEAAAARGQSQLLRSIDRDLEEMAKSK